MNLPDFLTRVAYGAIRVTGTRIDLMHLIYYYNEGYCPEMLFLEFPSVPLPVIHKVIAFYLENQADVDAYIAQCQKQIEQHRAAAKKGPTTAELRRRLEAMRRAESS